MIKQISVMEPEFKKYGKVIGGYDLKEILQKMEETPCPDDVVYVASVKAADAFLCGSQTDRKIRLCSPDPDAGSFLPLNKEDTADGHFQVPQTQHPD